jgi:hypothetical protein
VRSVALSILLSAVLLDCQVVVPVVDLPAAASGKRVLTETAIHPSTSAPQPTQVAQNEPAPAPVLSRIVLSKALKTSCEHAPKPSTLSMPARRVFGLSAAGDRLFYSAGPIMSMPKDGSPATKLRGGDHSGPIAVLGRELYFVGDRGKLAHMHTDGTGYADLALEMGAATDIQSDGFAVYAGNFGCYSDAGIAIIPRSGIETKLSLHCPHAIAGRKGVVYFTSGEEYGPKSVMVAGPDRAPEVFVPAQAIDARYLAATENYVYFYVREPADYLVRVARAGGPIEAVARTGLPTALYAAGPAELLFEVTDSATGDSCFERFDESTHRIQPVSSAWSVSQMIADDQFYYFGADALLRSAK